MTKEVKILIPDHQQAESVDIKVMAGNEELITYRLEVFAYPQGETDLSRAEYLQHQLESYDKDYEVVEIGLDSQVQIPVLFKHIR